MVSNPLVHRRLVGIILYHLPGTSAQRELSNEGIEMQGDPDQILLNGTIWTGDATHPYAESIAISGSCVLAVGSSEEIEALESGRAVRHSRYQRFP